MCVCVCVCVCVCSLVLFLASLFDFSLLIAVDRLFFALLSGRSRERPGSGTLFPLPRAPASLAAQLRVSSVSESVASWCVCVCVALGDQGRRCSLWHVSHIRLFVLPLARFACSTISSSISSFPGHPSFFMCFSGVFGIADSMYVCVCVPASRSARRPGFGVVVADRALGDQGRRRRLWHVSHIPLFLVLFACSTIGSLLLVSGPPVIFHVFFGGFWTYRLKVCVFRGFFFRAMI